MPSSASKSKFQIDAYQSGIELLVLLKGRLVLGTSENARERLHSLVDAKVDKFYLYLGGLEFVDSACARSIESEAAGG